MTSAKHNPAPQLLLELAALSCERDGRLLFTGLNQSFNRGDIVQVKGPNGSGKTTLLRALTGLSDDYEGNIRWRGEDLRQVILDFHNHLLYIGHLPAIKRSLTAAENLAWFSGMDRGHRQIKISEAMAEVNLAGYEDIPCHHLSAGQLRRVALARLYLTPALVWILDEPFTAIDVAGVEKLRAAIRDHANAGGLVILTTHQDLGVEGVKVLDLTDFRPSPAQLFAFENEEGLDIADYGS